MSRRHLLAIMVLTLALAPVPGGVRAESELPIRFHRLMLEDGLSQSSIVSLHQDSRGFIWMGTQDGLNRYDGARFLAYKSDPDKRHSISGPNITSIAEDDEGNLWIGTEGSGFNEYVREYEIFVPYRNDPTDEQKHHFFDVRDVLVAPDGRIWLATLGDGLLEFAPETESITTHGHDPDNPASLPSDVIHALLLADDGTLWVGTDDGLSRFDPATGAAVNFRHDPTASGSIPAGAVQHLSRGRTGRIWLGQSLGLASYDLIENRFVRHGLCPAGGDPLVDASVTATLELEDGQVWVGTEHRGLFLLDPLTGRCRGFQNDPQDHSSLSDNEVMSIMLDRTGVLWIGTSNGVNRVDTKAKQFYHVFAQQGSPAALSHDCVWALWEDRRGDVWAVTEEGLNLYHPESGSVEQFVADPDDPYAPSYNSFIELFEDSRGRMWMSARDGALNRYDPGTGVFERFPADADSAGLPDSDRIFAIEGDSEGRVWMGSMDGIEVYDPVTATFSALRHDPEDPTSLPQGSIRALVFDHKQRMWVSAWGNGVSYRDPETGEFHHFRHRPDDPTSLSGNIALCVFEDSRQRIWVGTSSGLNLVNPETGECLWLTERDGLPNNTIYGIQEDNGGNLWFSTNYGLAQFDPETGAIKSYTAREGIQDNEFNMGAYHVGRSGMMYFGGIRGFTAFYPDSIRHNPYVPAVVLTDFRLFNKPVLVGPPGAEERPILTKSISEAEHIDLAHGDNVISFEFAVLHFASPEKNRYAYKLEGFEEHWNDVGTRNHATYTNLPPGHYTFRVRGTNNDGVWNTAGTSIEIYVHPPFYRRPWFIALAILLLGSSMYGMHRYRMRLLDVKNKLLERSVAERTEDLTRANSHLHQEVAVRKRIEGELREAKDTAEAATRAKSDFLANMSHEIRTPMNGVLGMTSIMLDTELTPEQREYSEMIFSSARNLLVVINDILDFSKIEAGKLDLEEIEFDLCQIVDEVADVITLKASEKGLHFSCAVGRGVPRFLRGDPGRLRQVLTNLANNAIKFTDHGEVQIRVNAEQLNPQWCELRFEVRDTGVGIPTDRKDKIFQSFTQVDASITRQYGGTGLGLAIVKQLVDLMGGEVGVESEVGQGATFHFTAGFQIDHVAAAPDRPLVVGVAYPDARTRAAIAGQLKYLGHDAHEIDPDRLQAAGSAALPAGVAALLVCGDCAVGDLQDRLAGLQASLAGSEAAIFLVGEFGTTYEQDELEFLGVTHSLTLPLRHDRLEAALASVEAAPLPALTGSPAAAVTAPPSSPSGPTAPEKNLDESHPLILLAEDNPINQRVAGLLLEKIGYRVDVASNGVEVLEMVARNRYAAILMDVQMPRMDGLEAARRIRAAGSPALDRDVPIIALTAHAMKQDRRRSLAAGMDDHVSKPMDSEVIADVLTRHIEGRKPEPVS